MVTGASLGGRMAVRRSAPRILGVLFALASVFLVLGTGVAYLATGAGTASAVVTAPTLGSRGGGAGQFAALSVTPVAVPLTVTRGHAQLAAGLETARIDIASGATGTLLTTVNWLNSQDAGKVLQSPNSYILVGLYQADATATAALGGGGAGGCPSSEYKVDDSVNGWLCVEALGGNTVGILTKQGADAALQVPVTGITEVYVLTSIYVSNNAPPNQQGSLPNLQFYVSAHLAG